MYGVLKCSIYKFYKKKELHIFARVTEEMKGYTDRFIIP
jgi:hypothetical protein